ncbi:MAG TPA: Ldh family oxidoreductase [Burkholderiales bacterium]|nr:Ldh family oxidoreductase [Burkholderiales bacterium]
MSRILAVKKNAQALLELATTALRRAGANDRMAEGAARHLVHAEEQGLPTHGMSRVPFYCGMLRKGRADGKAEPSLVADRAAACLIDNHDGLPYVSVQWAVEEAIQRARRNGIGFAGIRNSAHVGVLGIHLLPVARAGLVGFAFTNSPAAIPPWGGKKPLFGTNPVAAVFPRADEQPIVIDLALTTVVRGRIMMAMRKGERIPDGWALDRDGRPTNDPKEAIEHGSLFPIGGAKGAMLALMFELICAALTGSAIGPEADSFFSEEGNKPRIGQAFIAVDPGALAGTEKYLERVETVVRTMLADAGVRLPGARRFAAEKSARAQGIEVPDELLAQIEKLAQQTG